MKNITVNEWLGELAKIEAAKRGKQPPGMSTNEIRDATGLSMARCRDLIRSALLAGRCKCGLRNQPAICGAMRAIPVYEIVAEKLGKKK